MSEEQVPAIEPRLNGETLFDAAPQAMLVIEGGAVVRANACARLLFGGVSRFPVDAQDEEMLLQHADAAMYDAKRSSRGGYRIFTGD
jgi:predicted signal transduction protein with EAL and GGDEF domain